MGRKVRIICTNRLGENYPIIALVNDKDYEMCYSYTEFGKFDEHQNIDCDLDLFFAPEKHEGWVNVYKSENNRSLGAGIWQTEEEAKKWEGAADYVTTIKIEWEE